MKKNIFIIWILIFLALILIPNLLKNLYLIHIMTGIMIFISLSISFSILARTGQVSIGQAAFFGIGVYAAAIIHKYVSFFPILEFIIAGIVSSFFALIIGVITLRLKGIYFSIATLCFAQTLLVFANMERKLLGGATGIAVKPLFNNNHLLNFYFSLFLTVIIFIINYYIFNSKIGYASIVIRNDERVANAVGINPVYYKIICFLISAFLTGVIGAYYIHYVTFVVPDEIFSSSISVAILAMSIFGGLYTIEGPFFGAFILKIIEEYLRLQIKYGHLIVYGLILIISVLFMPEGLIGLIKKFKLRRSS